MEIIPATEIGEANPFTTLAVRMDEIAVPVSLRVTSLPYKLLFLAYYPEEDGWAWHHPPEEERNSLGNWMLERKMLGRWYFFPEYFHNRIPTPPTEPREQ